MHIGCFAPLGPYATPSFLAEASRAAEGHGFHSIWVPEHVLLFDEYASQYPYTADGRVPGGAQSSILEPLNLLSFLAAATTRIRLGTGICLVPQRNPVYTAKEVATVDYLSGGRVDFGVGIGWLAEEFAALGVPWERRAQRTRAYLEVMRRLWCDPVSSYDGEFYHLPPTRQNPKPVQQPHPPIHFGGESDAALRRVADIGQGWFGYAMAPDAVGERVQRLTELLEQRGRALRDVTVTIAPSVRDLDAETIDAYRRAGVDQLVLAIRDRNGEGYLEGLAQLGSTVVESAAAV